MADEARTRFLRLTPEERGQAVQAGQLEQLALIEGVSFDNGVIWTKIRIEVQGARTRLFVQDQSQPTLIVNDLKTGDRLEGGIALWIDVGTEAHFRDVIVTPAAGMVVR